MNIFDHEQQVPPKEPERAVQTPKQTSSGYGLLDDPVDTLHSKFQSSGGATGHISKAAFDLHNQLGDLFMNDPAANKGSASKSEVLTPNLSETSSPLPKAPISQTYEQRAKEKTDQLRTKWKDEEDVKEAREKAYQDHEQKIRRWIGISQQNNIKTLLCTLHTVLWPGNDWKILGLADIETPGQVKTLYYQAVNKYHPDKNQGKPQEQIYVADRIFNAISEAWKAYQKEGSR